MEAISQGWERTDIDVRSGEQGDPPNSGLDRVAADVIALAPAIVSRQNSANPAGSAISGAYCSRRSSGRSYCGITDSFSGSGARGPRLLEGRAHLGAAWENAAERNAGAPSAFSSA